MYRKIILSVASLCLLAACSTIETEAKYPEQRRDRERERFGKVTGDDGWVLFGSSRKDRQTNTTGLGVNAFLWRATLDTLAFMPIASADPFGGVIITDWYSVSETPNERFKVNAFILDQQLRSDAIIVTVFRQIRDGDNWQDRPAAAETAVAMENAILSRARELRVASVNAPR